MKKGDLKPPILRRLEAKPQKSENFDNRLNKKVSKNVSKSCNDIDNGKKPPLVDSLKIFRNINPVSPSSRVGKLYFFVNNYYLFKFIDLTLSRSQKVPMSYVTIIMKTVSFYQKK